MRVLVTGGFGFIGSHVAAELSAAGAEVRLLDDASGATRLEPPQGSAVVEGDVRDGRTVARCVADVDVVVHQAAKVGLGVDFGDAPDYTDRNVTGTAVLLAAMARASVGRLVLASSMVVYGEGGYRCLAHGAVRPVPRSVADLEAGYFDPRCPICAAELVPDTVPEDASFDPRNPYAITKVAQEHLAASWARETGGQVAALRYHNVYGPGMPKDTPYCGVAALFRSALEHDRPPRVFEDGQQRRDFVHVRDVARANALAVDATIEPGRLRAYNVGSGEPRTVGELATELARCYGGPEPVVTGEYRLGDVRHITAATSRIRHELGFAPRESFDEGLAEFARAPVASDRHA